MKFCSNCAAPLIQKIPPGDSLPRHVCTQCQTVFYVNPKMIVGALVHAADRVLLCQRAIEPQYGKWTLPAGFMEMHETTAQGAMREMREEAGAEATLQRLYSLVDVPHLGQTHLIYRATLNHEQFYPGEETLALAMFSEAEVPWEDIAFESVRFTLEKFFIDVALQHFDVHVAVVGPG